MLETIEVNTRNRTEFIDITSKVRQAVQRSGIQSGMCYLFLPHTTAAITINENADPNVQRDMLMEMNKVIPFDDNYTHYEGNSAAHVKSSLFGVSQFVIVEGGELVLGTWQGIYFCEFDGARRRKVIVKLAED